MLDYGNKVIVKPGLFSKKVLIPTSKSFANRILILASLCPKIVTIEGLPESTDVSNLIDCLEKIGIKFNNPENLLGKDADYNATKIIDICPRI